MSPCQGECSGFDSNRPLRKDPSPIFSMTNLTFFIFFLVILFILTLLTRYIQSRRLPYYKNSSFITNAELSFFKVLEKAVANTYYIFPQVNLASLVKVNAKGSDWWKYFGKINKKSIDFILADKTTCKPILAIELDDSSHKEFDRQKRDEFVNKVFAKIGIPILHVVYKNGYNITQLQEEIKNSLRLEHS